MIWFDLFGSQSPRLVEHSCSARMNWDLNKVIIIIIIIIIIITTKGKERKGGKITQAIGRVEEFSTRKNEKSCQFS